MSGVAPTTPHRSWTDALVVLAVVVIGYALWPTRIPLHGEETCRALHGVEMAQTGDWLIATNQFVPILDRPPMQYWLLALVHRFVHELDPLTLRLSMALVTAAMALVIWAYARRFLTRSAALLAGVTFPTIGHVFDLGQRVETDGLFTLFLAAGWLVWHAGHAEGRRPYLTWSASCALAACAVLTKGLQGGVAFFGTIYAFLLLQRRWRDLFGAPHLTGLAVFFATIAIWQVPFLAVAGWEGTRQTWLDPLTGRVTDTGDPVRALTRLLKFPLTMLGAAVPWSALLAALTFRPFRTADDRTRDCARFALVGIAVTLAPVWLSEGGLRRHAMPLYALLAVLSAAIAERAVMSTPAGALRKLWTTYVRTIVVALAVLVGVAVVVTAAASFAAGTRAEALVQPWPLLVVLVAALILGARWAWRAAADTEPARALHAGVAIAFLLAACYAGVVVNAKAFGTLRVPPLVAELRATLPAGAVLHSLGPTHHRFVFWYPERIPVIPKPGITGELPEEVEYFAVTEQGGEQTQLPFEWETIAVLSMDRKTGPDPIDRVVIGHVLR